MSYNKHFIIEVTGYDGEYGSITVLRYGDEEWGEAEERDAIFCAGEVSDDGVIRIVDWGYPTIEEAFKAWPEARPRKENNGNGTQDTQGTEGAGVVEAGGEKSVP